jgi:hypothetical protein
MILKIDRRAGAGLSRAQIRDADEAAVLNAGYIGHHHAWLQWVVRVKIWIARVGYLRILVAGYRIARMAIAVVALIPRPAAAAAGVSYLRIRCICRRIV